MTTLSELTSRALSFAHLAGLARGPKPKRAETPSPGAPRDDAPTPPAPGSPFEVRSKEGTVDIKGTLGAPPCWVLVSAEPNPELDAVGFALVLMGYTLRAFVTGRGYAVAPSRSFAPLADFAKALPEHVRLGPMAPGEGPSFGGLNLVPYPVGTRAIDVWGTRAGGVVMRAIDTGELLVEAQGNAHVRIRGRSRILRDWLITHAGVDAEALGLSEDAAGQEDLWASRRPQPGATRAHFDFI